MGLSLTDTQKAYIAGFIDGEGYIGIAVHRSTKWQRPYYSIQISVYSTDPDILFTLRDWTALGSVNIHQREDRAKHHRLSLTWRIGGQNAKSLLNVVLPYLRIKRRQAELAIQCPSDGRFRNNLADQVAVKEAIMILNQGGR